MSAFREENFKKTIADLESQLAANSEELVDFSISQTRAISRIADLESQLAAANVAITEWAMRLKGAQSEIERMRPVVMAAVEYVHAYTTNGVSSIIGDRIMSSGRKFDNAVREYEKSKPTDEVKK